MKTFRAINAACILFLTFMALSFLWDWGLAEQIWPQKVVEDIVPTWISLVLVLYFIRVICDDEDPPDKTPSPP